MNSTKKPQAFDLKKSLFYCYGTVYPVSGGLGLTENDPVIIEEDRPSLYLSCETFIAKVLCAYYGFWEAKLRLQSIKMVGEKIIDVLQFDCVDTDGSPHETTLFFDISIPYAAKMGSALGYSKPSNSEHGPQDKTLLESITPLPNFQSAVHLAFIADEEHPVNIENFSWSMQVDEKQAQRYIDALEGCNALNPAVLGIANAYKKENWTKNDAQSDKNVEVTFVHTLPTKLRDLIRKRKAREAQDPKNPDA